MKVSALSHSQRAELRIFDPSNTIVQLHSHLYISHTYQHHLTYQGPPSITRNLLLEYKLEDVHHPSPNHLVASTTFGRGKISDLIVKFELKNKDRLLDHPSWTDFRVIHKLHTLISPPYTFESRKTPSAKYHHHRQNESPHPWLGHTMEPQAQDPKPLRHQYKIEVKDKRLTAQPPFQLSQPGKCCRIVLFRDLQKSTFRENRTEMGKIAMLLST